MDSIETETIMKNRMHPTIQNFIYELCENVK